MIAVIDVVHPHMPGATAIDDHIEATCVPSRRRAVPEVTAPTMHPAISVALAPGYRGHCDRSRWG